MTKNNNNKMKKKKVGRNNPCPCDSGLKHKKCCLGKNNHSIDEKIVSMNGIPEQMYFYYKGDTDDGITLAVKPKTEPKIFEIYKMMRDGVIEDIEESDDIDESYYVSQLEEHIKMYWLERTGDTKQPPKGHIDDMESVPMTESLMSKHLVICGDIWALSDLGVIPQDNHNGTLIFNTTDYGMMAVL